MMRTDNFLPGSIYKNCKLFSNYIFFYQKNLSLQMKTLTDLNSYHLPIFDTSFPQKFPVSFQTHSQCQLLKIQDKKQRQKLFGQVFTFVQQIIESQQFYSSIRQFLMRHELKNDKNSLYIINQQEQERVPFQNLSFKKVQITSTHCFQSSKNTVKSQIKHNIDRRCAKKISIIIFKDEDDEEMFSSSDSLISDGNIKTLKQIKLPSLKLTQELIRQIYQAPSPFLMNLSLCLFLRYCIKRNAKPDWNDAAWILAIATIEAFKLYYDQQFQGMFEWFESVLKISRQDLVDLERCFLEKIDYNIIIQNYDYQFILSKFVQIEKFKQKENKSKHLQK